MSKSESIGVIGLGYVGFPLCIEFSKKYNTIGYDIDSSRVEELSNGIDRTCEIDKESIINADNLLITDNQEELSNLDYYIITVPTPIDSNNIPDLSFLRAASKLVGRHIKDGSIVVFECTVFPGCTEEICIPIIEEISNFKYNIDFYAGYSPERINPGDKEHSLKNIVKVVSGSNDIATKRISLLYSSIIDAGIYIAESIKVAEAAKVIENTQRDLNIAFVNELKIIFDNMDIDTNQVLNAASTKWNFLKYAPGLVGGHCIGVDPFYLTYKSEEMGYRPEIILAGRSINDGMHEYYGNCFLNQLSDNEIIIKDSDILIMGFTFKENIPDIRNTKVYDLYNYLIERCKSVTVVDPHANLSDVQKTYKLPIHQNIENLPIKKFDGIFVAVNHSSFRDFDLNGVMNENSVVYSIKVRE